MQPLDITDPSPVIAGDNRHSFSSGRLAPAGYLGGQPGSCAGRSRPAWCSPDKPGYRA